MESNIAVGTHQKVATLFGGILVLMPNGVIWFWGNMAVYVLSYVAMKLQTTSGLQAPWIISLYTITWIVSLLISNEIGKSISRRWAILIGIVISDLASFFSYFAIQKSLMVFNFTFGALLGLGTGLLYGNAIQLVIGCAGKDIGLFCSVLQGSFAIGSLITVQAVTWFINPQNYAPYLRLGHALYFTQKDIIDKVPHMFLIFGCCSLIIHIIGLLLLLQFNPYVSATHISCPDKKTEVATLSSVTSDKSSDENVSLRNSAIKSSHLELLNQKSAITPNQNSATISSDCKITNHNSTSFSSSGEISNQNSHSSSSDGEISRQKPVSISSNSKSDIDKHGGPDYTPTEVLKSLTFYSFWILFFLADVPYILLTNYYKIYGQLWIHNDHFLATVGTASVLSNIFFRLVWGMALDRCKVKHCFIFLMSSIVLNSIWFFFTPMVNRWLFFMATLLFSCSCSGLYACFMSATALVFGKKNVSTNYGLVLTSSMIFNFMAPAVIEAALTQIGWFFTFAGAGILNILALVLCIICLPQI